MGLTFTPPKLCDYGGDTSRPWFVWFDVTDTETGQSARKQFRGGINYYHKPDARRKEGNALAAYWKKRLDSGLYNPFQKSVAVAAAPENVTEAVKKIIELKLKALKRTSRVSYSTIAEMFTVWCCDLLSIYSVASVSYSNC